MRAGPILLLLLAPASADAFRAKRKFDDPAWFGGADGRAFTGARRWRGYSCAVCHVPAADPPTFVLRSDPPELVAEGRWVPGRRYVVSVELFDERLVPDAPPDETTPTGNSFNAELVDEEGDAVGTLDPCVADNLCAGAGGDVCDPDECDGGAPPRTPIVQRIAGGTAVHADVLAGPPLTEWSFAWTAPQAGTGEITLHLAGVDGDGDSINLGDAVAVARVKARESASGASMGIVVLGLLLGLRRRSVR